MPAWSPEQETALKSAGEWLRDPRSKQVFRLFGAAGTGKSTLAKAVADMAKGQVMFAAFTGKASMVMRTKGCADASTIHSLIYKIDERDGRKTFVLNPESPLLEASLLILDECFFGSTLVDTPSGQVRIDQLTPGDKIQNAIGIDTIVAISRKVTDEIAVVACGEKKIACSKNHPFFTTRGLIRAADLRHGDTLVPHAEAMRLLQGDVLPSERPAVQVLLTELFNAMELGAAEHQGKNFQRAARSQFWGSAKAFLAKWFTGGVATDRQNKKTEPHTNAWRAAEDQRYTQEDWAQATYSGGQWSFSIEAAGTSSFPVGRRLEDGIRNSYRKIQSWLSEALQNRLGPSFTKNRDRSRWGEPSLTQSQGSRPKKNGISSWPRVESIEILEQGNPRLDQFRNADGFIYIYDLQARRHHSFSVEGLLVHNCSMVSADIGNDLLSFGTKILVLGDPFQLPPIKGTGFFTHDPENPADVVLTQIHRQAEGNPIIELATKARMGDHIAYGAYGESLVIKRSQLVRSDIMSADQIIVGTNKTRQGWNRKIRAIMSLDPDNPMAGDKLVCLKNNRSSGFFNGSTWTAQTVNDAIENYELSVFPDDDFGDLSTRTAFVRKEFFGGNIDEIPPEDRRRLDEFAFGYAITGHKAQGSQYDSVVVLNESFVFAEHASKWLYTSLTRAAKKVVLVT